MIYANRSPSPTLLTRTIVAGLIAVLPMLAVGCGSNRPTRSPRPAPASATSPASHTVAPTVAHVVVPPDTSAGVQVRWLLSASAHLPISAGELKAHFAAEFLARVSPADVNGALANAGQILGGSGTVAFASLEVNQPRRLVGTLARAGGREQLKVSLAVDDRGLISGLLLQPVVASLPATWSAIDGAVHSVAPQARMLVAEVTAHGCRAIHAIDPAVPAPLGSAFKLYVLNALGSAVASGRVGWSDPLTVTSGVKSLPSGDLQALPDGTRVSVEDAAAKMISISDNTAANLLIDRLGRSAVERSLAGAGMADPALDQPFLTTRELFVLKLERWPEEAERYARADAAERRKLLAEIDRMPLPTIRSIASWTAPRAIGSIEWFASADDLCRVYTSLRGLASRPGLSPIARVLELNDDGLGLDPARWQSTWYKGGSEPGVLTMTYLATTRTGRSYFAAVLAENPQARIDESRAVPAMLSAIKGALTLAASSG